MEEMSEIQIDTGDKTGQHDDELRIEKIVSGGYGLGRDSEGVIFIPYTVPGDLIRVGSVRSAKGTRYGEAVRILEPGPGRREAPCRYYYRCGGCDLQHIEYAAQLNIKKEMIREALIRQGGFDPGDSVLAGLEMFGSDEWNSRNRVQIHAGPQGPGFMEARSNRVLRIETCPVVHPRINRLLAEPELRGSSGEGARIPVFADDSAVTVKEGTHSLEIAGKHLSFDVRGFFQSNLSGLEHLITWVRRRLDDLNVIAPAAALDIYGGVGFLSSLLPGEFTSIDVVEINRHAETYVRRNLGDRGRFYAMDASAWARGPGKSRLKRGRQEAKKSGGASRRPEFNGYDLVIVDPPRKGLDAALRKLLLETDVPNILYVSCDPVTFSRDLARLKERYTVHSLAGFDFSPHNHHVEAAAWLERSQ
ncbi:RNA methyltransferase, TrmA family [Salinispira pacifica]|uniref:RNA methyltransferase, TrmA family n=2 Tax=Salinispira pacifica TaxID=1307761 RepID=V5WG34_9SPIO|nr:RNA methyltransferase, TrmA family [Salinispira pacifica]